MKSIRRKQLGVKNFRYMELGTSNESDVTLKEHTKWLGGQAKPVDCRIQEKLARAEDNLQRSFCFSDEPSASHCGRQCEEVP